MIKNPLNVIFVVLLSCCFIACSEKITDPETEIREYIKSAKNAAENRSHSDFSDLVHDTYSDQKGMDKPRLIKTLRAYFFTHKNIFLFTKIENINFLENNQAFVVVHIAMSGKLIESANSLTSLRAKIYRFELLLEKENQEWLLKKAKWKQSGLKELL